MRQVGGCKWARAWLAGLLFVSLSLVRGLEVTQPTKLDGKHSQHHPHPRPNGGGPHNVVWGCSGLDRGVALTFDDGPTESTAVLLDHLRDLGVKATFFVCGANAVLRPDLVKRAFDEGHEIGSHTWSHANLTKLHEDQDWERLSQEIDANQELIQRITGVAPRYLRPPYGAINTGVAKMLEDKNITVIMWSGGCIDWLYDIPTAIPFMVNGLADSGSLLCMHDSSLSTCNSIKLLVDMLITTTPQTTLNPQGRRILSLSECLAPHRST